ncbi:MAG: lactonase family protein [Chitinophagaceae bacterium]
MRKLFLVMAASMVLNAASAQSQYLLTGTYTGGKSKGIYVYSFDNNTGRADSISMIEASNPSFIAVSPDGKYVFAVHENGKDGKGGTISSYSFNKNLGQLRLINTQSTEGDYPCYVEVDKSGKWVFAANYGTGNFTIFPVSDSGSLGEASVKISHQGSGTVKDRQEGPHVHSTNISPDNKILFVADLGIDKVMIYSFNAQTGELIPAASVAAESRDGSGPRHMAFHPTHNWVYLMEEISGTVVAYEQNADKLKEIQRISSIPADKKGDAGSADIHVSPDGKFLYASNRGDFNDLVIYQIDPKKGTLKTVGFQSTLGKGPRNFSIDPSGKFLLVANQNSDEVVIFNRDAKTGKLVPTSEKIIVGNPVCLKWISK